MSVLNTFIKYDRVKFEDYKVAKEFLVDKGFVIKFVKKSLLMYLYFESYDVLLVAHVKAL